MMSFADANAFFAYCYLLSRCWEEISTTAPVGTLQRTTNEMIKLIRREARSCSVREASEWFSVLRLEPWAGCLQARWGDVLSPFSARIDSALRQASNGSQAEAAHWIEFLRELARMETRDWLAERLCEDRFAELPARLAWQALEVLATAATMSAARQAKQLQRLTTLQSNQGESLWSRPELRRALWACLMEREDRYHKAWTCLEGVLDVAMSDLEDFQQWIDISLTLEGADFRFDVG